MIARLLPQVSAFPLRRALAIGALLPLLATAPALAETVTLKIASGSISNITNATDGRLDLVLTPDSLKDFRAFQGRNKGKRIDVMVGGKTLISPTIKEPIQTPYVPIGKPMSDGERRQIIEQLLTGKATLELRSQ
ncbi:hypothetical protein ACLBXM_16040 [Xanthobacteraceae bacterium A53D]